MQAARQSKESEQIPPRRCAASKPIGEAAANYCGRATVWLALRRLPRANLPFLPLLHFMKYLFWLATALLLGLLSPAAQAQGTVRRHLIYFQDKTGTPYSVSQPQAFLSARALARRSRQGIAVRARDLPVNPAYVTQVRAVSGNPQ
nr:hypothetical protein [Tanacetum cinerariifolium]